MGLLKTYTGQPLECGVDEVGRGCLAGPVVACAVILPDNFYLSGLRDSKKLSEAKRIEYSSFIRNSGAKVGIGIVSSNYIDTNNILEATYKAMHEAITRLGEKPTHIIVDGDRFREYESVPHTAVVKGDDKYMSIAAASVVAKVYRDELMSKLALEHPGYGWENNKGYGTPEHISGIREFGLTKWHRSTFISDKIRTKGI